MTRTVARIAIACAVGLVLGAVNWSIHVKERIKSTGVPVLLELAPIDPRSLMQGDYMALSFALAREIRSDASGTVPVVLDSNGVGRLAADPAPGALRIRYRLRQGQVWLGTNAYFFEEDSAGRYAGARYGEFRVDRQSGEAVLVGMRGPEFERL
jgi:uncharacterized membrane-anchored protein